MLLLSIKQSTPDFMIIGEFGIYTKEYGKNAQNTKLGMNFISFLIVRYYNKKKLILPVSYTRTINTINLKHVMSNNKLWGFFLKKIMFIY